MTQGSDFFNNPIMKDRVLPFPLQLLSRLKLLPREGKKKKTTQKQPNFDAFIFNFFFKKRFCLVTKFLPKSPPSRDPTVSLLNYIERVQSLAVSGTHQS